MDYGKKKRLIKILSTIRYTKKLLNSVITLYLWLKRAIKKGSYTSVPFYS